MGHALCKSHQSQATQVDIFVVPISRLLAEHIDIVAEPIQPMGSSEAVARCTDHKDLVHRRLKYDYAYCDKIVGKKKDTRTGEMWYLIRWGDGSTVFNTYEHLVNVDGFTTALHNTYDDIPWLEQPSNTTTLLTRTPTDLYAPGQSSRYTSKRPGSVVTPAYIQSSKRCSRAHCV